MREDKRSRLQKLVLFSILLAIEAIVCFTPLGSLPAIGPIVATLSHIPVIATAVVMGTGFGAAMGFFFGLFSFLVWTLTPPNPLIAFCFTPFYKVAGVGGWQSVIICFVPRILIGVVAGLVIAALKKRLSGGKLKLAGAIAGVLGSLVNTFGVLFGIYFFYGRPYAEAVGIGFEALLGVIMTTVLTGGLPEAVIGGVLSGALAGAPLPKFGRKA